MHQGVIRKEEANNVPALERSLQPPQCGQRPLEHGLHIAPCAHLVGRVWSRLERHEKAHLTENSLGDRPDVEVCCSPRMKSKQRNAQNAWVRVEKCETPEPLLSCFDLVAIQLVKFHEMGFSMDLSKS